MAGFIYTLRLLEPVLANSLAGDSNSARSLPFIPGSLIRGALVASYLREHDQPSNKEQMADFRRLFLTTETRYLHAYLLSDRGQRAYPTPLSWKVQKGEEVSAESLYNLAGLADEEIPDGLKSAPFAWWWQMGKTAVSPDISYQINVHTQRDAVLGRSNSGRGDDPDADRGTIYRYESLPAGTTLQGVVLTQNEHDSALLKGWLGQEVLMLGKARTAGYGRIKLLTIEDLEAEHWQEGWSWQKEASVDETSQTEFCLTFLSEGLVRNTYGQFTLDPTTAVRARLGLADEHILETTNIFRSSEIVGGFNRHWGLPLPQVWAIAPGSVFCYRADPPISAKQLTQLASAGLGERRNEGFGRVLVEYEQNEDIPYRTGETAVSTIDENQPLAEEAKEMAQMILKRLLVQELDERLLTAVRKNKITSDNLSNSQLSRWQLQARNALNEATAVEQLQYMTTFYTAESNKRSRAWEKMRRARVDKKVRLTDWLQTILTGPDQPWKALGYTTVPQQTLPGVVVKADEEMAQFYKMRLIDLVLAARVKANKVPRGQAGGNNG